MKKAIVLALSILFGLSISLFGGGISHATPLVISGGEFTLDYSLSAGTETPVQGDQEIYVEVGFDIEQWGNIPPGKMNYADTVPKASAYVDTTYSAAEGSGDTDISQQKGAVGATADWSQNSSYAYCSTFRTINFTLDRDQSIEITYSVVGYLAGESSVSVGSIQTAVGFSIQIDGAVVPGEFYPPPSNEIPIPDMAVDELFKKGVNGVDSFYVAIPTDDFSDTYETEILVAGEHTILIATDIYANATVVPEPATVVLLLFGMIGVIGIKRFT